jgi:hypothetical protein
MAEQLCLVARRPPRTVEDRRNDLIYIIIILFGRWPLTVLVIVWTKIMDPK